jgi:hypothetical protein
MYFPEVFEIFEGMKNFVYIWRERELALWVRVIIIVRWISKEKDLSTYENVYPMFWVCRL